MDDGSEFKDTHVHNFMKTLGDIQRQSKAPNRRGIRVHSNADPQQLAENLRQDIHKIATSPLSQLESRGPVPELSTGNIQSLRDVYSLIKEMKSMDSAQSMDKRLKELVKNAAKSLNPRHEQQAKEESNEDLELPEDDMSLEQRGMLLSHVEQISSVRKSARLAAMPKPSYGLDNSGLDDLLGEEKSGLEDSGINDDGDGSGQLQGSDVDDVRSEILDNDDYDRDNVYVDAEGDYNDQIIPTGDKVEEDDGSISCSEESVYFDAEEDRNDQIIPTGDEVGENDGNICHVRKRIRPDFYSDDDILCGKRKRLNFCHDDDRYS